VVDGVQVGLLALQMTWTSESEAALREARYDKRVMPATNQRFLEILNQLIDVTTHELTRIDRTKFETLVTIHVHQKDIFDDLVSIHSLRLYLLSVFCGSLAGRSASLRDFVHRQC